MDGTKSEIDGNPPNLAIYCVRIEAGATRINTLKAVGGNGELGNSIATGDSRPDIACFGENHTFVGRNNGNGTYPPMQPSTTSAIAWVAGASIPTLHHRLGGRQEGSCHWLRLCWSMRLVSGTFGPANLMVNNSKPPRG